MDGNTFIHRAKRALSDPRRDVELFMYRTSQLWTDKTFIRVLFWARTGNKLNLKNPQTFNEKQNWLKLYDRNPLYTQLVDKYRVKQYVADKIGSEFVVPCLGVWDNPELIDFSSLPDKFVLKCNHNSGGGMCICRDKNSLDQQTVIKKLAIGLKDDFYKYSRVWPYKDVKRCVLADIFLDDHTGTELRDYKFWCFNGEPKVMYCTNKGKKIYENYYDMNFAPLNISHGYDKIDPEIEKPAEFELMKGLATKLSEGIPFVRIDFFDIDGHVYFGEYTFFDWGGMKLLNEPWEHKLGEWINIDIK